MFKQTYVLLLAAGLASTPALAQQAADDARAAVPETRYTPAHVQRAPAPNATTPDRNWQESNRTVASQDAHAGHAGHSAHAGHAKPAEKKEADPHAGHHDHMDHH